MTQIYLEGVDQIYRKLLQKLDYSCSAHLRLIMLSTQASFDNVEGNGEINKRKNDDADINIPPEHVFEKISARTR